jgi:hypothetical protein
MHDLYRPGIVDAEVAGGLDQRERLETARFETADWRDLCGAHALGQVNRMRHVAVLAGWWLSGCIDVTSANLNPDAICCMNLRQR